MTLMAGGVADAHDAPAVDAPRKSWDFSGSLHEIARSCQRALDDNPAQPAALVGMCLVAMASHQNKAAIQMASAAVEAAPQMPAAWVALGQALRAAEQYEEAAEAFGRAIRLDGTNALARLGLGDLKMAEGRAEAAIAEFEMALRREPAMIAAHLGLGNALALLGRAEAALARYETALTLRPRLAEGEFAAGFALQRLGRLKEAETRYRRAITARRDFAAAWINLGSLLREVGQDVYAEAALRQALELRPDLISGWVNLAILERERSRPDAAEACLRRAFALNPTQVETLVAWCQFRAAERDLPGAWGWLRWALALHPEVDEAVNLNGILLQLEGRQEEAIARFERAEALGNRAAASNRGNSLLELGRMDEAIAAHEEAVAHDPARASARYNLALTQLRLGNWEQGWSNYEARWGFREVHRRPRRYRQPRWHGESLRGERVLLHAEQGLGDTIQFCRYAALVAARGGVPILQVQPAAERLMHSFPARLPAAVRAGPAQTALLGTDPAEFDLECPLLSLPAVFGTTVDTVPWEGAYLSADSELAAERLAQFPSRGQGLRIGIAWAGNPRYKADSARSTRLTTLLPVLREAGTRCDATFISLQKGAAADQLRDLPNDVEVWDGSSCDSDLAETASLVAGLDLVITTDTCIAHLAGAMAKPVWILLPYLADWRWMREIETTPWYPSARLFRQRTAGDWQGVLERVNRELDADKR